MPHNLPIFISLSITSSLLNSLAVNLLVYGEKKHIGYKIFAIICLLIAGLVVAIQLNYGPISLAAPFGVLTIFFTPIIAYFLNHENIEHIDKLLVIAGCCLLCFIPFTDKSSLSDNAQQLNFTLRDSWQSPETISIVTIQSIIIVILSMIHFYWNKSTRTARPMFYMVLSGLFSGIVTLTLSTFINLFHDLTIYEVFGLIIVFNFVCTASAITMNYALANKGMYQTSTLYCAQYVTTIILNTLNGGIINRDFNTFTHIHYMFFFTGIALCITSLLSIYLSLNQSMIKL